MPSMPLLDYRNKAGGNADWIIYSDHISSDLTTNIAIDKKFFLCDCKNIFFSATKVSSVFQKCDLTRVVFSFCYFTKDFMLIDCVLSNVKIENCIFESEEQLVYLKMLGVHILGCRVEGKNGTESWNL